MIKDKLKFGSGIVEGVLSIPLMGWTIYCFSFGIVPIAELVLGIVGLVKCEKKVGSILQICAAVLGWIPLIGWMLHIVSAIFLIKEGVGR